MREDPHVFRPKPRKDRTSRIYHFTYRGHHESTRTTERRAADRVARERASEIDRAEAGLRRADQFTVAEILTFYRDAMDASDPKEAKVASLRCRRLMPFWGSISLVEIRPKTDAEAYCEYVLGREDEGFGTSPSSMRKDADFLNKALRYHRLANLDLSLPEVVVAKAVRDRSRRAWLSSQEVARLIYSLRGRVWDAQKGDWSRQPPEKAGEHGPFVLRSAEWRDARRWLIRLILLAVYSGTRVSALLDARWEAGESHASLDVESGNLSRRGFGEGDTEKSRPTVRLPAQAHLLAKLWRAADERMLGRAAGPDDFVVNRSGAQVSNYHQEWVRLKTKAGLGPEVVFHSLRHTCATWLIEGGATIAEAADFLGVHPETFSRVYLQYAPHFAQDAAEALDPRRYNPKAANRVGGAPAEVQADVPVEGEK